MQSIKAGKVLGSNIRKARKSHNFTQEQLAAKLQLQGCDVSRGTLAKIEAGIRHVSIGELNTIKQLLNMTYEDFFMQ